MTLREALSLFRGDPLGDLSYEPWAQTEVARLARAEARGARGSSGGRARAWSASLAHRRAGEARRPAPAPRAASWSTDAGPLSLRQAGRRARRVPGWPPHARRGVRDRARVAHCATSRRRSSSRTLRSTSNRRARRPRSPLSASRGAFVGRDAELGELRAGLDEALAGRGRLFLLAGEPGIGKSRLADELSRHASGRGAQVLVGRCWEAGGAPAYWPWIQALRAYVRDADGETTADGARCRRTRGRTDPPGAARVFSGSP